MLSDRELVLKFVKVILMLKIFNQTMDFVENLPIKNYSIVCIK